MNDELKVYMTEEDINKAFKWSRDTIVRQAEEIERLRGILKRVTPDPVWGEDSNAVAFYKEARAALQPEEDK